MGALTYRFSLDIHKTQSQVSISASQYSTDIRLIIRLMERGIPYEIEEGCFAVFSAIKPDGNPLYNDCMIENNTIIYDFTEQTTPVNGIIPCQIHLYGADGRPLLSPRFQTVVHKAVYDGKTIESSAEYLALSKFFENSQGYIVLNIDGMKVSMTSTEINESYHSGVNVHIYFGGNIFRIRKFDFEYNIAIFSCDGRSQINNNKSPVTFSDIIVDESGSVTFRETSIDPAKQYTLNDADKQEIANLVIGSLPAAEDMSV